MLCILSVLSNGSDFTLDTMRKILIALCVIIWLAPASMAQDTLRMMQYNLMYYTNNSGVSDCTPSTNNLDSKDANIKTIFHYVRPDVFCVNEIGSNVSYADRLLNNDINVDGIDYYRHGPMTNYSGGYIANMIFYDSRKLSLYDHYYITTSYRDINGYKMYYNSTDLALGDTVFITFWVMHLKAGSYESNASARRVQAQRLMQKLASMAPDNHVVSGDFNLYSAEEPAYQELIHYSNSLYCLYDPVNQEGEWNSNYSFSDFHTQSTHGFEGGSSCFSTGGMDDRFDFILVSPYVYYGSKKVQVLPNTYHALGQDGIRCCNNSLISPTNTAVPSNVANALYNQSDHLPVITDFLIDAHVGVEEYQRNFYLSAVNPVRDQLTLHFQPDQPDQYRFEIYSVDGRLLQTHVESVDAEVCTLHYPFDFPHGVYFLKVSNSHQQRQIVKLVK